VASARRRDARRGPGTRGASVAVLVQDLQRLEIELEIHLLATGVARVDLRSTAERRVAIVADVVGAYRGSLRLDASALGGLRAEVELPGATP
jgi:hypothetical protein